MTKPVINLVDVKKYYSDLPHQVISVNYLGEILLTTPAKEKLGLTTPNSLLNLSDDELEWLTKQLTGTKTLEKFAGMFRSDSLGDKDVVYKLFNQRDNSRLPMVTCSSSSHAMYADWILRRLGKKGLSTDEGYLKQVFSGKYDHIGKSSNRSLYWDVHNLVLKTYGIQSKYIWNGDLNGLKKEVEKNGMSVVNIYHKGTHRGNRGGGHVVCAADFNDNGDVLILDPFGERPPSYQLKNVGQVQNSKTVDDEYDTLHRLVLCEARSEGLLGMALVARVVLNRVNVTKARLENYMTRTATIDGIVFAKNQFEPTFPGNANHISTIYDRTDQETQELAHQAIKLALNPSSLATSLKEAGYDNAKKLVTCDFFAATYLPQAISPYVVELYTVKNQVLGMSKRVYNADPNLVLAPYEFKKGVKTAVGDAVGQYWMDANEFSWRFQGCWRQLLS